MFVMFQIRTLHSFKAEDADDVIFLYCSFWCFAGNLKLEIVATNTNTNCSNFTIGCFSPAG
jgi:hypothetical protein